MRIQITNSVVEAKKKIAQSKTDLETEFDNIHRLQTILGMRVNAVEDQTVLFVFTQIDRRNADREFCVKVSTKNEQFQSTLSRLSQSIDIRVVC